MEVLNQLLSNHADYLNALRHAQQMPISPTLDTGDSPKFKVNGKLLIQVVAVAGILYLVYRTCRSMARELSQDEE